MCVLVFITYISGLHVKMMKKEQVAGSTGAVPDLQHARVARLVSVLVVKSVGFQTAAARLALISLGMQKLKLAISPIHPFSNAYISILFGRCSTNHFLIKP